MHEAAAEASSLAFRVKLWMTSPLSEMSLNSSWTQLAAQTRLLRARARVRVRVQDLLGPPLSSHPVIFIQLFFFLSRSCSCSLLPSSLSLFPPSTGGGGVSDPPQRC